MKKPSYSPQFREQALAKVLARKDSTIDQVASDLNIIPATLKSWIRDAARAKTVSQPHIAK